MLNKEIYEELEKHFTKLNLLNYCLIRSKESLILFEDDVKNKKTPSENEYDAMWWDKKFYILKKELQNES